MFATIYTRPGCQQCRMTDRAFRKLGVTTQMVQVDSNLEEFEELFQGARELPGVVLSDGGVLSKWTGFRPDLINQTARG